MTRPDKDRSALFEITPLSDNDCLYVIERHKTEFKFPIHTHREFELNYIENGSGAKRIIGDSIEEIGNYDLVLISNAGLEHGWQDGNLEQGKTIREITIQFSDDWLTEKLLSKNQFSSIRKMLKAGENGLAFPLHTILEVRPLLNSLTNEDKGFYVVTTFLTLLYELSVSNGARTLASTSFANTGSNQNRRIMAVDAYLRKNFTHAVKLSEAAKAANMSNSSFSRFFSHHTGKSFTDYLIDIRIGNAARMLIDTDKTIAEICYSCGYNNLSNFNRIFRRKKGCTPSEFRELYRKKQVIV